MGVPSRAFKPYIKTQRTAFAAFGFLLEPFDVLEPVSLIVIGIDEGDVMLFSKANVLLLADVILSAGVNVGIVEVDRKVDMRIEHGFDDLTRARGAARVQEHFCRIVRRDEFLAFGVRLHSQQRSLFTEGDQRFS